MVFSLFHPMTLKCFASLTKMYQNKTCQGDLTEQRKDQTTYLKRSKLKSNCRKPYLYKKDFACLFWDLYLLLGAWKCMILFRLAWFCLHYTEMPKYIVETISFPCCCNAAWFSSFLHQQQRLWWCIFFVLTPFFSQFYRYHVNHCKYVLSRLKVFSSFWCYWCFYHDDITHCIQCYSIYVML